MTHEHHKVVKKSSLAVFLVALAILGIALIGACYFYSSKIPKAPVKQPIATPSATPPAPTQTQTSHHNNSQPPSTRTVNNPTAEATLANCHYEGGPPAGRNCPATPPPSYSNNVSCMAGGNPIACPDWSYARRIAADFVNGESYCLFTFWGSNSTGAESKKVQVTNANHPGSTPDCSIEQPI